MATPTPRIALTRDDDTMNYDVGRVNSNSDKVDEYIGATPCTSTTRPSSGLFNGRLAYETDTDAIVVYRTALAAWRYASVVNVMSDTARDLLTPKHDGLTVYRFDRDWYESWNGSAWRIHGSQTLRGKRLVSDWTDIGGSSEVDLFDMNLTAVPIVSGYRYIFHLDTYANCTAATSWLFRVRKNSVPGGAQVISRMVYMPAPSSADQAITLHMPWNSDETNSAAHFRFSVQRFGSGVLDLKAAEGTFTWVTYEDGPSGAWS